MTNSFVRVLLCSGIFSLIAGIAASFPAAPQGAAFVHLFEWSWSDVAIECETFLGPKGFKAVQISPPQEHSKGSQWWTRYQPVSYQLTSRSGNETQFIDMVQRCTAAGVDIYADAVINHMAAGSGTGIAGTSYGGRTYANYSSSELHHNDGDLSSNCQVTNYDDKHNVQYCDLVSLPDLCTGCSSVQATLGKYLTRLRQLGVKGIRIDAAKHQDATELSGVLKNAPSDLLVFQEVIFGAGEAVKPSMYYGNGLVTEFNYAYSAVGPNVVNDGKIQYLKTLGESWGLMPTASAVVFLDNHDTQRGGAPITYKSGQLYTFANIFMLSCGYGYPKVMSSYYFDNHDQGPPSSPVHIAGSNATRCGDGQTWVCEHRQPAIANMIKWRKVAGSNPIANWNTISPDQVSFSRGSAFIALNRASSDLVAEAYTGLAPGQYCNIIKDDNPATCEKVQVEDGGKVVLNVGPMTAMALHLEAAEPKSAVPYIQPVREVRD